MEGRNEGSPGAMPHIGDCARYDGAARRMAEVSESSTSLDTSPVLDASDRPHVTNQDLGPKYAYRDGGEWKHTMVEAGLTAGGYNSLALNDAGRPHVAVADWEHPEHHARYPHASGPGRQTEMVDTVSVAPSRHVDISLALGRDAQPHVSYQELGAYVLKYATNAVLPVRSICLPHITR